MLSVVPETCELGKRGIVNGVTFAVSFAGWRLSVFVSISDVCISIPVSMVTL